MARKIAEDARLLTPAEVAELFRVDSKTASRWAAEGKLPCVRTPGGRPRFREAEILALLNRKEGE